MYELHHASNKKDTILLANVVYISSYFNPSFWLAKSN